MIERGELARVQEEIHGLKSRYPESAEVLYISGLVETDGEKALMIFKDVLSKYPDHKLADDALLKVIEYIYTKGLYRQTIKYVKQMLYRYPESDLVEQSARLLISSFRVMNKKDSVDYYLDYYDDKYPELRLAQRLDENAPQYDLETVSSRQYVSATPSNRKGGASLPKSFSSKEKEKKRSNYSIQVGVFSVPSNAYALRDDLKTKGYDVFTHQISGRKGLLLSVRLGGFNTKSKARYFGERLKKKEKLNYIIVENL